jgi:hypothetical protein
VVAFFGELPRDPAGAAAGHDEGLGRLEAACAATGVRLPPALAEHLAASGPFPMPLGFELSDDEPMLKIYARLEGAAPGARRRFGEGCLAIAGAQSGSEVAGALFADTEMVCVGVQGERVVQVKAYVRRDPTEPVPEAGLAALPEDHPLLSLSAPVAYAVVDLHARRSRPAKWDLNTRGRLLTGPVAARTFGDLVPTSRAALEELFDPRGLLIDVVAVALRGSTVTLYFEVC